MKQIRARILHFAETKKEKIFLSLWDFGGYMALTQWLTISQIWTIFDGVRGRNREGDGTPLQYSCLENPMDGGAW